MFPSDSGNATLASSVQLHLQIISLFGCPLVFARGATFSSRYSKSGRSPASVILVSPLRSKWWSWGHRFPTIAKLVLPNPGQLRMDNDRENHRETTRRLVEANPRLPHFTRERLFNLLQIETAFVMPLWVIMWDSSSKRYSRDPAARANAPSPPSETKHSRRHMLLIFVQPFPTASRLKSVTPH